VISLIACVVMIRLADTANQGSAAPATVAH